MSKAVKVNNDIRIIQWGNAHSENTCNNIETEHKIRHTCISKLY